MVRCAMAAVMEKTPFTSLRCSKLQHWGQELLDKVCHSSHESAFDSFCQELIDYFQETISALAKSNNSATVRARLWSEFHKLRMKGKLPTLWRDLLCKLDMNIDDPLLEQSIYQEVFEMCLLQYFADVRSNATSSMPNPEAAAVVLTSDELNVMRYVCGYVARSLLKKYEQKPGEIFSQYVTCLSEIAVEGEGEDILSYTKKWFNIVNRGGLYPLHDEAFHLFIEIEKCVRTLLPRYATTKNSDQESMKRNIHEKIFQNEEVQFHWALLSQDIDCPKAAEVLLIEIIKLWVTIRGFSMVASWMEAHKSKEKRNTEKSTGLRKSLSGIS